MSQSWQCPQCKAINPKPEYILRLAKLKESLGTVSLGTTGSPPPRCSQCQFEANLNSMLAGDYDHAGSVSPVQPLPSEVNEHVPQTTPAPRRAGRTLKIIGAAFGLLVLLAAAIFLAVKYTGLGKGTKVSPPPATSNPTAFPSVRILGQTESLKLIQTRKSIWTLGGKATDKPQTTENMVKFTIHLVDGSEPLIWDAEWCATTEAILAQNLKQISYTFILNGISIPREQFRENDYYDDDWQEYCFQTYTILVDWTPGEYLIKTITRFTGPVNDGRDEYPAGTRTTEYHVTVTNESP